MSAIRIDDDGRWLQERDRRDACVRALVRASDRTEVLLVRLDRRGDEEECFRHGTHAGRNVTSDPSVEERSFTYQGYKSHQHGYDGAMFVDNIRLFFWS
jgi:hypothetical protein